MFLLPFLLRGYFNHRTHAPCERLARPRGPCVPWFHPLMFTFSRKRDDREDGKAPPSLQLAGWNAVSSPE
jgi:hypothetical protein